MQLQITINHQPDLIMSIEYTIVSPDKNHQLWKPKNPKPHCHSHQNYHCHLEDIFWHSVPTELQTQEIQNKERYMSCNNNCTVCSHSLYFHTLPIIATHLHNSRRMWEWHIMEGGGQPHISRSNDRLLLAFIDWWGKEEVKAWQVFKVGLRLAVRTWLDGHWPMLNGHLTTHGERLHTLFCIFHHWILYYKCKSQHQTHRGSI